MNGRIQPRGCDRPAVAPFDLHGLKTYDLASRPSKVFHDDLGRCVDSGATINHWLDALPRQLAANALRRVDPGRRAVAGLDQRGLRGEPGHPFAEPGEGGGVRLIAAGQQHRAGPP